MTNSELKTKEMEYTKLDMPESEWDDIKFMPIVYSLIAWTYVDIAIKNIWKHNLTIFIKQLRKLESLKEAHFSTIKKSLNGQKRTQKLIDITDDNIYQNRNYMAALFEDVMQDLKNSNKNLNNESLMITLRLALIFFEQSVKKIEWANQVFEVRKISIEKKVDEEVLEVIEVIKGMLSKVEYSSLEEQIVVPLAIISSYSRRNFNELTKGSIW